VYLVIRADWLTSR